MEERTIIQSENIFASPKMKRLLILIALMIVAVTVLSLICRFDISRSVYVKADKLYDLHYDEYHGWDSYENENKVHSLWHTASNLVIVGYIGLFLAGLLLIFFIAFLILYLTGRVQQITVTDKRVYGVAAHKRRVDLPLDSVSAISTSAFKGLAVATAAGRINFIGIKNRDDIHKVIGDLLIERQSKPTPVVQGVKPEFQSDIATQLKQLKELLDSGILTQEEFDAKKKQILGL